MKEKQPRERRYILTKGLFENTTVYGIELVDVKSGKRICAADDISDDIEFVRDLVERFNDGDLDPIHLPCVIEDELFKL